MAQSDNLANLIDECLPAELVEFMQEAGLASAGRGERLYLVGGVVRDLLLNRPNLDIDLVLTGNAIDLAKSLSVAAGAKVTIHPRFGTATLAWGKWRVDIATSRSEHYNRPGALPTIHPGNIHLDLLRRDFTINAMAVELAPNRWGELIDIFDGMTDLRKRFIRVLHDDSFIDDATRIWRGLRYEQRLDFRLEPHTLRLLKRDISMLETISPDRTRHELELILAEEFPEKVIRRADKLKVLLELHPGFRGDAWMTRKFRLARRLSAPGSPSIELYMALLAYRLTGDEVEKLISRLRLNKAESITLRHTNSLKERLEALDEFPLQPSCIYEILSGNNLPSITANHIAAVSPKVKRNIDLFISRLRNIKPALTGADLQELGVPPGPEIKAILHLLLEARLDGEVEDSAGETRLVEEWLRQGG